MRVFIRISEVMGLSGRKSISSRDVAREAGVSQATVSYILNDVKNVRIKPETRAAVWDAVRRLNYHPDEIARGMRLKRSMSVGVVTDRNVTNFYFMKTLEGIRDGVQRENYAITLLFNKPGEIADAEYVRYYKSNRLDGIIFAFASLNDEMAEYLNENGIPFVRVDAVHAEGDIYQVCSDYLDHIPKVIDYFIAKGASRIGFVGPSPAKVTDSRFEAFGRAMRKAGLDIEERLVSTSDFNDDEMFAAVSRLLDAAERPDALLAGSPRFGLVSVKCAQSLGIRIPDELRIIALGTSNFFNFTHPSLSAVELPLYDMGYKAAEILLGRMNGNEALKSAVLAAKLIMRGSC